MRIGDNERYEIKAHAFQAMTGFTAPGKDEPDGCFTGTMERREEAWRYWIHTHERIISRILQAVEEVLTNA